jgi:geranylgeranyl diphosphate synthase type I
MKGEELLNRHLGMVDEEIKKVFETRTHPAQLYDMMKYHLGWLDEDLRKVEQYRGKRFRPTLCLLVYNSLSGVYDKALPAAAAIELIHNFSLIHDDIEDMDEERRHKATVWKLWGISQAINVGDGMHVLANLAALRLADIGVTSEKVVEVMKILNETIITLCEGQYLDMSFEERLDITIDMYLDMIRRKTAALVEASAWIGATLATEDESRIESFRNFGRSIGLAFQIIDDIIGIWEKAEQTGKPKASDIRNRKKTLPILYSMEMASEEDRKLLRELYSRPHLTDEEVEQVLGILEASGAYEFSRKMAEDYEKEALAALQKTGIREDAMADIKALAEFLIRRKY